MRNVGSVSIGVAGSLGPDVIARIAPHVERAGFHALWVNDTPTGDALAALAAAAAVTERLVLATGVLPVDRRSVEEIADAAARLPQKRLVLGIGSGGARTGALELVTDAAHRLREATRARILVGALGPRMRQVAVTAGEGPLLSWLTPDIASVQANEAYAVAPDAHVALYARTALDDAARPVLDTEVGRYASYPNYARNFARLGIAAGDTVMDGETFAARIPSYRMAVDEVVLRAIVAEESVDAYIAFVKEAARLTE